MMQLGMGFQFLNSRKNGPCPMCGGKDRWRFTDHESPDGQMSGGWWCNNCGHGYGMDLVMTFKGVGWAEALKLVESVIGGSPVSARRPGPPPIDTSDESNRRRRLWGRTLELTDDCLGMRYLRSRGLTIKQHYERALRWVPDLPYYRDGDLVGRFHALIARLIAPDDSASTLIRIYVEEPGVKAPVPKPRLLMPGPVPEGGAVRLGSPQAEMGIAEGVETALAASIRFGMPVWAVLSTNGVLRFRPPPECKRLIVYVDWDPNHAGQAAGHALAHRLRCAKLPVDTDVEEPPVPRDMRHLFKVDWNDWLVHELWLRRGEMPPLPPLQA
jgi:putative DNA primase/helicase